MVPLRTRIAQHFDDSELHVLCADHFPEVAGEFTTGMRKGDMIRLLLRSCAARGRGDTLLTALDQARPGLVGADRDALLAALATESQAPASPPRDEDSLCTPTTVTAACLMSRSVRDRSTHSV